MLEQGRPYPCTARGAAPLRRSDTIRKWEAGEPTHAEAIAKRALEKRNAMR